MPLARVILLANLAVLGSAQESRPWPDAEWTATPVTAAHSFTAGAEGPVCDAAGNLFACNFEREGTIGKITPDGKASVFAVVPSGGRGNGLRIDSRGYLIAADYVNHMVHRIDPRTGEFLESLTRDWAGLQFRQPNDIGIAADDSIYFTDPDWQSSSGGRIFLIRPGTKRQTVLLDEGLNTPNGITVSPDGQRVYVSQSRAHNILVYDRRPDGTLENRRVFLDLAAAAGTGSAVPDGVRCDVQGNVYVGMVGLGRILIIYPDGTLHPRFIQTGGKSPTNITFCGPERRILYITEAAQGRIERVRVAYAGLR